MVGDDAAARGAGHPDGYLSAPRRGVGYPAVTVNGYDLDPADPIRAIVRHVLAQASGVRGVAGAASPDRVVLTHPDDWSPEAIRVLFAAVEGLGLAREQISVVPETVAAVRAFDASGALAAVPDGAVAVVDVGGASTDVGVFTTPGLESRAARRDERLGAEGLDIAVRQWVDRQLAATNPALLDALRRSMTPVESAALAAAVERARRDVEERDAASIPVSVGGAGATLTLTAGEYAEIVGGHAHRIGEMLDATVAAAGVGRVAAICVTGGASTARAVYRELHRRATVIVGQDPAVDVVIGALQADAVGAAGGYPAEEIGSYQQPRTSGPVSAAPGWSGGGEVVAPREAGRSRTRIAVAGVLGSVVVGVGAVVLSQTVFGGSSGGGDGAVIEDVVTQWLTAYGDADDEAYDALTCAEYEALGGLDKVKGRTFTVTGFPSVTVDGTTATAVVEFERTLGGQTQAKTATVPMVQRSGNWNVCVARDKLALEE
ncbi:Hsp70 family protein [Rhodococcus triatomae]